MDANQRDGNCQCRYHVQLTVRNSCRLNLTKLPTLQILTAKELCTNTCDLHNSTHWNHAIGSTQVPIKCGRLSLVKADGAVLGSHVSCLQMFRCVGLYISLHLGSAHGPTLLCRMHQHAHMEGETHTECGGPIDAVLLLVVQLHVVHLSCCAYVRNMFQT